MNYEGVFALLTAVPVWLITLCICVICQTVGFVLADRSVGLSFNVSYASVIGDLCLNIIILIGATVLQRNAPLPAGFGSGPQVLWLVVCITVGIVFANMTAPLPNMILPDRYHNLVVVPVYLFLIPLMVLTILHNGTRSEIVVCCTLIAVWGLFFWFDFSHERLNQPEYIIKHLGLRFEKGRITK